MACAIFQSKMTFRFWWYDTSTITSDAHVVMLNEMKSQESRQPYEHQSQNNGFCEVIQFEHKICNTM